MIKEIGKEITSITSSLISIGISQDQNFASISNNKVTWANETNFSQVLKNIPYNDKYEFLSQTRNYNIKLVDGALLQFQYFFDQDKITAHRLAYFPQLTSSVLEDNYDYYDHGFFKYDEFIDVFNKRSFLFPVRFDYDISDEKFIEVDHPYSHAHLGEIENCRIPVSHPLLPSTFINFIIRHFYSSVLKYDLRGAEFIASLKTQVSITNYEKKFLHFNIDH